MKGRGLGSRWTMLAALLSVIAVLTATQSHPSRVVATSSARSPIMPTTKLRSGPASSPTSPSTTSLVSGNSFAPAPSQSRVVALSPTTTTVAASPPAMSPLHAGASLDRIENGWLSGPTAISATYDFAAPTRRAVTASFQSSSLLTLSLSCDGAATTSTSGTSSLSLMAQGASCTVTLSGPAEMATTTYSLNLGPA